jgi:predicted transposase/invertase (TIGR01784 family)
MLLPEEEGYLNRYEMRNTRSHKAFTELQETVILELPKVPEEDDGRPVWAWLKFMKIRSEAEFNALAAAKPEEKMAVAEVQKLSWSEGRCMRADARQIWRWDMATMIQGAREEEREKNERRLEETARKMKEWGDSLEKIHVITGLSTERIEKL